MNKTKPFKRTALSKSAKSMVSTLLLLIAMLMPQGAWAISGSGTSSSPYLIANEADLRTFQQYVENGNSGIYGKLTADITLTSAWTRIGRADRKFTGYFDGQGHTISGMNLSFTAYEHGFFGFVNNATIKNFTLKGTMTSSANGNHSHGTVVGSAAGTTVIENVTSSVNLTLNHTGFTCIGGIVGHMADNTRVTGCTYTGTINLNKDSEQVGGIVGYAQNDLYITNNVFSGTITSTGTCKYLAGIAGKTDGTIEVSGCTNIGTINGGPSYDCVAGIVGYVQYQSRALITNCYFGGSLSSTSSGTSLVMGGILGAVNDGAGTNFRGLTYCFSDGTLTATNSSSTQIGGIAGVIKSNAVSKVMNNSYLSGTASRLAAISNSSSSFDSSNKAITISVTAGTGGTVKKSYVYPTSTTATQLQVVATPNSGYHYVKWSDNGAQTHNVSLTDNVSLSATFGAHNYGDWTTDVDATCISSGTKHRVCATCSVREDGTIAALGHSLTATPAKAATCTEAGNNAYWTCSTCKKVFSNSTATTETTVAAQTIAASGHSLTATPAKAATCTEAGNNAYWTCSTCKKVFSNSTATTETTVAAQTIVIPHPYIDGICHACNGYETPAGNGTSSSPYLIGNQGNLLWFADKCTNTNATRNFHAKQTADIVYTQDSNWWGLGSDAWNYIGTYDGNGHTISGLKNSSDWQGADIGMFGYIGSGGKVMNLGLLNVSFSGRAASSVGAFAYWNRGTITNCYATGSIYGHSIAGICPNNSGSISNCYVTVQLTEYAYYSETYPIANKNATNCYSTTSSSPSAQFTSGEVCYKLNGGNTSGIWKQTIGTDQFPVFDKDHATVYSVQNIKCDGVTAYNVYTNNSNQQPTQDAHDYQQIVDANYLVSAATCTADAVYQEKCSRCTTHGAEWTAAGTGAHIYTEESDAEAYLASAAGCNDATYYYKCANCDEHGTETWAKAGTGTGHTFAASDLTHDVCTVCNHGFLRYEADSQQNPDTPDNLKDKGGNKLQIVSHTFSDDKGVIEFNAPLVEIGDQAFARCHIKGITIPNTVTTIGEVAFAYTDLTSINIPNSVKTIGISAFSNCWDLSNVTLGKSIESIGDNAFEEINSNCNITLKSLPQISDFGYPLIFCNVISGLAIPIPANLELDDNSFVAPESDLGNSSIANHVTYTRTGIKNQWGTIVVPFSVDCSGDYYDFYTLSSVSNDELTLTKVDGFLPNGTPALIRINSELVGDGKTYDLTLTATSAEVDATGTLTGTDADGLQLTGTYAATQLSADDYFISNNKFWRAGDFSATVKAAPFRAYLKNTGAGAMASALRIAVEDDSATAIDVLNMLNDADAEYYDLNGRRIPQLQKGINIVKYGNGKTKKVSIK